MKNQPKPYYDKHRDAWLWKETPFSPYENENISMLMFQALKGIQYEDTGFDGVKVACYHSERDAIVSYNKAREQVKRVEV